MSFFPQPQNRASAIIFLIVKLMFICSIIIACVIGGIYAFEVGYEYVKNPTQFENRVEEGDKVQVEIPSGASTEQIAEILKQKNLIKYPILFRAVSAFNRNDGTYQQGLHTLDTSMEYLDIMKTLQRTVVIRATTRFTILEGHELRHIIDVLESQRLIDREKFMDAVENGGFNYPFLSDLPERENRLEGYLFPETYEVYLDATEEEIIRKMLDQFNHVFKPEYYERAKELGMTVDEVITLASIIEREAQKDDERPKVSAVFHNRLNSNAYPLLQSCATVQYVLGERKDVLLNVDLAIDSPYNTYMYEGLPIGPIASPGQKSIEAALYPADVDYLFFVARPDGSHVFSMTLREHENARIQIQRR